MFQNLEDTALIRNMDVNVLYQNMQIEEGYNKHLMPPTDNGEGLYVNISLNLNSILSIDEPTQVSYCIRIKQRSHIIFCEYKMHVCFNVFAELL